MATATTKAKAKERTKMRIRKGDTVQVIAGGVESPGVTPAGDLWSACRRPGQPCRTRSPVPSAIGKPVVTTTPCPAG